MTIGSEHVNQLEGNQYLIESDEYNFDFRRNEIFKKRYFVRNVGTLVGSEVHNCTPFPLFFGGEYDIYYVGTVTIQP